MREMKKDRQKEGFFFFQFRSDFGSFRVSTSFLRVEIFKSLSFESWKVF